MDIGISVAMGGRFCVQAPSSTASVNTNINRPVIPVDDMPAINLKGYDLVLMVVFMIMVMTRHRVESR